MKWLIIILFALSLSGCYVELDPTLHIGVQHGLSHGHGHGHGRGHNKHHRGH